MELSELNVLILTSSFILLLPLFHLGLIFSLMSIVDWFDE